MRQSGESNMKNKLLKHWLIGLSVAGMMALFFFFPLNLYVEKPGAAVNLAKLIFVDNQKDTNSGSFSLTYVSVNRATPFTYLKAKVMPYNEILSKQEYLSGEDNPKSYQAMQAYYMQLAEIGAKKQALTAAKIPFQLQQAGIKIINVYKYSDFYDKLAIGDIITHVNNQKITNAQVFSDIIKNNQQQKLSVTVLRGKQTLQFTGKLVKKNNRLLLGIQPAVNYQLITDKKITFKTESFGGPSAGLMFALELYEQLSKDNIRKGKNIAGTGTMELDGSVGQIGGIDKKVVAAAKAKMDIFFAPKSSEKNDNYKQALATAKAIHTKMKIVPITSFQDAIDYLSKMK